MDSQNLKTHQWNNRIVLVFADDQESKTFQKQITELKEANKGCTERKLVMYQVLPNQVTTHYFDKGDQKPSPSSSDLYKEFMVAKDNFKFVLIGLDGGVKEKRTEPISSSELFSIIDGMSMRQAQMRRDN